MTTLASVFSGLLNKPRITWLALSLASGVFALISTRADPPLASSYEIARLVALAIFLFSTFMFILTIAVDLWGYLRVETAKSKRSREFRSLTGPTRALLAGAAVNTRSWIWLPDDFSGLAEIAVRELGYIADREQGVVKIELFDSAISLAREALRADGGLGVDDKSKAYLRSAISRANKMLETGGVAF